MSAIWGTISFHSTIFETADLAMRTYYDANCKINRSSFINQPHFYFGCGIQYITPEAETEVLPYFDPSRNLCYTADCLLDNRTELMQELKETDHSVPDGTLILHAFYKWGIQCVHHLRGLFSFAIYDLTQNRVYLVADQLSSRCLYYYRTHDQVSFSTLLTPLHSLHPELSLNQLYLKDYLTAPGLMPSIISNETPYAQVYKLNPGTYVEITPTSINEVSYWTPAMPLKDCVCKNPKEYGFYFRTLYEACIQNALRTNGNVGIALSSGLDSASVGAIAADSLQKENKNLFTYTYVPYEDIQQDRNPNNIHNEMEDVQRIAQMHPNMVSHFLCNDGKNCFDGISTGMRIMEIPYKAYGNLPSLFELYDKASNNSCKVMLSGQMGNSTVSYGNIDHILYDLYSRGHYLTFLRYLNQYSKTVKESRKQALKGCIRYFKYTKKKLYHDTSEYQPDNPFLTKCIQADYSISQRYSHSELPFFDGNPATPRPLYQKYLYLKAAFTYLGELETKAGLAYGMILRDPTKDMRMLSFCYHLPYHLFAYQGIPRWLIRTHCKDLLPSGLLNNWLRYGVQNSDCHERLIRDWSTLYPVIKEQLGSNCLAPYIDVTNINAYLNRTQASLGTADEQETEYVLFLNVLHSFLQLST